MCMTEQVDPQHRAVSKLVSKWLSKVEFRASEARARLETDWAALPQAVKATFRNQPTSIVLQFNPSGVSDCVLPTHLNVPHIQSVVQRALTCISHELFSQQLAHGKLAPCTPARAQPAALAELYRGAGTPEPQAAGPQLPQRPGLAPQSQSAQPGTVQAPLQQAPAEDRGHAAAGQLATMQAAAAAALDRLQQPAEDSQDTEADAQLPEADQPGAEQASRAPTAGMPGIVQTARAADPDSPTMILQGVPQPHQRQSRRGLQTKHSEAQKYVTDFCRRMHMAMKMMALITGACLGCSGLIDELAALPSCIRVGTVWWSEERCHSSLALCSEWATLPGLVGALQLLANQGSLATPSMYADVELCDHTLPMPVDLLTQKRARPDPELFRQHTWPL